MTYKDGNGVDGKHYWLTPPALMADLQTEFAFDFDPCPFPKPEEFDGLKAIWGQSNYVNPPFEGPTRWVRKAIAENRKGKRVVFVFPVDKWVLMMLAAGASVRNLGDVKWCATEDGSAGKGTGRHIAAFVLEPPETPIDTHEEPELPLWREVDGKAGGTGINQRRDSAGGGAHVSRAGLTAMKASSPRIDSPELGANRQPCCLPVVMTYTPLPDRWRG